MDPWSAGILAAAMLGGAGINYFGQRDANVSLRKQYRFQEDYQKRMNTWSATALPALQKQGYLNAGVNPILAYGGLGSAQSFSSQIEMPRWNNEVGNTIADMGKIPQMATAVQNSRDANNRANELQPVVKANTQSQTDLNIANANKAKSDAISANVSAMERVQNMLHNWKWRDTTSAQTLANLKQQERTLNSQARLYDKQANSINDEYSINAGKFGKFGIKLNHSGDHSFLNNIFGFDNDGSVEMSSNIGDSFKATPATSDLPSGSYVAFEKDHSSHGGTVHPLTKNLHDFARLIGAGDPKSFNARVESRGGRFFFKLPDGYKLDLEHRRYFNPRANKWFSY